MTIRYSVTFRFRTRSPLTHHGTIDVNDALALVATLLEGDDPLVDNPPVSSWPGEPPTHDADPHVTDPGTLSPRV
jgi:hypothetical protein